MNIQTTHWYYQCSWTIHNIELAWLLCAIDRKEWINSRCLNKLQEILQGRFSICHMEATLLARLQWLCTWTLAFVSTHPWVPIIAVVCASRLIAEGPPSIVYRNGLVSYRNLLRQKYHIYPKGCVDSGNRGIYKCPQQVCKLNYLIDLSISMFLLQCLFILILKFQYG